MNVMRLAGRIVLTALCLGVLALVAIQFESILARNFAVSRELAVSRQQIDTLRAQERRDERTIRRLADPRGALPEIHDKLRWVAPHEEMIYLKGAVESPAPDAWGKQP